LLKIKIHKLNLIQLVMSHRSQDFALIQMTRFLAPACPTRLIANQNAVSIFKLNLERIDKKFG